MTFDEALKEVLIRAQNNRTARELLDDLKVFMEEHRNKSIELVDLIEVARGEPLADEEIQLLKDSYRSRNEESRSARNTTTFQ